MRTFPWPPNETGPCGSRRQPQRRYGARQQPCARLRPAGQRTLHVESGTPSTAHAHLTRETSPEPDQLELFA